METKHTPGPSDWIKENWTVGQYTPTESFKKIENHSCVCRKDDMGLIAITGPAEDLESQKLSDLIAAAPEMYALLKDLSEKFKDGINPQFGCKGFFASKVEAVLSKAEGGSNG